MSQQEINLLARLLDESEKIVAFTDWDLNGLWDT